MMQDGLHIGLAAWINAQRNTGSFAVYPAQPIATALVDLVYPPICRLCDCLLESAQDLCVSCRSVILRDPFPTCLRCGSTIGPNIDRSGPCSRCRNETFRFERVVRVGPYEGRRRDLVLLAKHDECAAEVAARIFADGVRPQLAGDRFDCVIAVPLHWSRAWRRQYNQSDLLARSVADSLGVPRSGRALRRVRPTSLQTRLTPAARRVNLRNAFQARKGLVSGRSFLLVDDVLTTGATAQSATSALLAAGANRVVVAVLAHG